ncbi:MAG: DUF4159 domain-containing protein [Planctomycetia bacterium]|nr:DUF4159 domain-containing protein [Planctomycetia bacterium]
MIRPYYANLLDMLNCARCHSGVSSSRATGGRRRLDRVFASLALGALVWALVNCLAPADAFAQRRSSARQQPDITPKMVQNAISGGVDYLKSLQNRRGNWNEEEIHVGGISSLCTLALLSAGETPDDPHVARALEYLRSVDPTSGPVESTYVAALQTMVFCMAEPKRDAGLIRRNVLWLQNTQKTEIKVGAWGYPYGNGDPSNSQFALLALYEADRLGLSIDPKVWRNASVYWSNTQNIDGSWTYNYLPPSVGQQAPGSGSMTCAGIVSLLIAGEKSELADALIRNGEFLPCQRQNTEISRRLNHAQKWMAKHFSVSRNPGNKDWVLYYLYGLERMGRMTEQRFIGGHDWYREGVAELLRLSKTAERRDRVLVYWKGASSSEMMEPIATSLALLFLSKGRYPVLLTKVQFTQETEDWNNHRHDIHNLARYTEDAWKKYVTTQNVDLETATTEDLLLSPVLFFSGTQSPLPKDAAQRKAFGKKLRDYVDRGGFILAEAAAPGGSFERGFRELLREIFPEKEHRLYPMPPEHPIWRAEKTIQPRFMRPIYCMDYGCRTCVVFVTSDPKKPRPSLSCLWELAPEARPSAPHNEIVKDEIRAGLSLGLNILAYATDRTLKTKEESFLAQQAETPADSPVQRGRLAIANLQHGGGCEAAPKALRNLLLKASDALHTKSGVLAETVSIASDRIFDFPILFMQGRYDFRLTRAERVQLRAYLDRGGLLFVNSICASPAFDAAFRREMAEICPDASLRAIPLDDPLYTNALGGFDLRGIRTRRAESGTTAQPIQLEGALINDRWGVIYSSWDLSCALEDFNSMNCRGYSTDDAAKIGVNVILYAFY